MLGARTICVTLLAVASFSSLTSAKLNMNHICALVNDGLMIASNDACDAYYTCSGGMATMKNCDSGKYFDKESQKCLSQDQVTCLVAANTVPCSGTDAIGTWSAVPGSCSDYYYCSALGPERGSCPFGENFNPTIQQCVWAGEYPCSVDTDGSADGSSDSADGSGVSVSITLPINLCNFIRNGIYFGSPSSCNGWSMCSNNVIKTGFCGTGYSYNTLLMECVYPTYETCVQLTNDPYLTSNSCTVQGAIKASSSCSSYYVCDGTFYQVVDCASGLFYDTVSKTCVNRLNARNNCDRCAGVTNSFVNQYSTKNCTGYLYCLNGQQAATGICPTGTYFDERAGACLTTTVDPMLGCCNPDFYNSSSDSSTTEAADSKSTDAAETTDAVKTTVESETTANSKTTEAATTTA